MVVTVQAVGNSTESSQRLKACDDSRFDHVARPHELLGRGPVLPKRIQLRVDHFLEVLQFHAGFGRHLHFEHGTKNQRLLIHGHVLRNLFFIHKFLVQSAGLSAAENRCDKICLGVARLENRRS